MKKTTISLYILITLICLVVVFTSLDSSLPSDNLAGNAFKVSRAPLLQSGCFLSLDGTAHLLTTNKQVCESLFISLRYDSPRDFSRLTKTLNRYQAESKIKKAKNKQIYFKSQQYLNKNRRTNVDYFQDLSNQLQSNRCETIEYFGTPLHCFNRVGAQKKDNLHFIVPYLTLLKYTSDKPHHSQLHAARVTPFQIFQDINFALYDLSKPELIEQNIRQHSTCDQNTAARHKKIGQNSLALVCPKMLNHQALEQKKIHYASVLYHEANHRFDQRSHNERDGHITCEQDAPQHSGDRDYVSVYGAQAEYLFALSKNSILSCSQRQYAFDRAQFELDNHLCQVPRAPRHDNNRPICRIPQINYQTTHSLVLRKI